MGDKALPPSIKSTQANPRPGLGVAIHYPEHGNDHPNHELNRPFLAQEFLRKSVDLAFVQDLFEFVNTLLHFRITSGLNLSLMALIGY